MWSVIGILAVGGASVLLEWPYLRSSRSIRTTAVFFSLLAAAVGLGILKALHVPLPNPLDGISYLFKPSSDWLMEILK